MKNIVFNSLEFLNVYVLIVQLSLSDISFFLNFTVFTWFNSTVKPRQISGMESDTTVGSPGQWYEEPYLTTGFHLFSNTEFWNFFFKNTYNTSRLWWSSETLSSILSSSLIVPIQALFVYFSMTSFKSNSFCCGFLMRLLPFS